MRYVSRHRRVRHDLILDSTPRISTLALLLARASRRHITITIPRAEYMPSAGGGVRRLRVARKTFPATRPSCQCLGSDAAPRDQLCLSICACERSRAPAIFFLRSSQPQLSLHGGRQRHDQVQNTSKSLVDSTGTLPRSVSTRMLVSASPHETLAEPKLCSRRDRIVSQTRVYSTRRRLRLNAHLIRDLIRAFFWCTHQHSMPHSGTNNVSGATFVPARLHDAWWFDKKSWMSWVSS